MNDSPTDRSSEMTVAESTSAPTSVWAMGMLCLASERIAARVAAATTIGQHNIRLFVNRQTVVPAECSHISITLLNDQLSPPAIERFAVAELFMRSPTAEFFLLAKAGGGRGIDHWCRRISEQQTASLQPVLFVDSLTAPSVLACTAESVRAYLSDAEGLSAAAQVTASADRFATSLTSWATRRGVMVVEIPVSVKAWNSFTDSTSVSSGNNTSSGNQPDGSIRISGASVSIVVPTWNCADFLAASVRSLLSQTVDTEIVIVDDASDDDTNGVLASFGDRITVVRHAQQRGANAARNTGLAAASGDFIAFADADNEYSPRWVERLLQQILADPASALAYCGYTKQASDGSRVENHCAAWNLDTLWYGNYIDMSSVVRRSAIPTEGLHEGFRPFDDWRLWLNMAQRGWHGTWVPEQLFVKHVRDTSKTEQSMANPEQRGHDIAAVRRDFAGLVGMEKPVSVVIPASGSDDLTTRCLRHLGEYCGVPFHVIYVDNGSPIAMLDTVAQAADDAGIPLRIIRNRENRGFTQAVNQGIEASGAANVLLLNNDCFIGPGCVENLARELRLDDRVAAAGPLTGDSGNQSLRKEERRELIPLSEEMLGELDDPVRTAFRLGHKLRSVAEPVLSFFCVLLRAESLAQYGGLDARFTSGLAADDEWCFRVRNHGKEVRLVLNAYAAHLHRSSFRRLDIDRDALQQDAKELLHRVLASGRNE